MMKSAVFGGGFSKILWFGPLLGKQVYCQSFKQSILSFCKCQDEDFTAFTRQSFRGKLPSGLTGQTERRQSWDSIMEYKLTVSVSRERSKRKQGKVLVEII